MGIFLFLIVLLNIAIFLSIFSKKDISETLFLSLISILLFTYLLGVIDFLSISIILIGIVNMIVFLFNSWYLFQNQDFIKKYLLKPALLFIVLAFIFAFFFFRNSYLRNWDEYTHWGLYPKNIFDYDRLAGSQLTSTNNGYPPITSLLQYIVLNLDSVFKESNLYRSLFLFSTIAITPFLKYTSFKKPFKMFIFFAIIICFPQIIFLDYFTSIYVDALLAVLFASLVLKLYTSQISLFNWIYMFLIASILMLVKEFGLILNLIFYFLLMLDILFVRRSEYLSYFNSKIKVNIYKFSLVILSSISPFLLKYSWILYLGQQATESHSQLAAVSISYPEYGNEVVFNFIKSIFVVKSQIGKYEIYPIVFIIISLIILFVCKLFSKEKKDSNLINYISLSSLISFVLYSVALLLSYLFLFGEIEARGLASYSRYISTILLAVLLISVITLLIYDYKKKFKNNIPLIILMVLIILLFPFRSLKSDIGSVGQVGNDNKYLADIKHKTADELVKEIPLNSRIYYICQGSNGFEYWFNRYYLSPNHIQELEWALCSESDNDYPWVWKKNASDWQKELLNYDYLYLERVDEKFLKEYSVLFEDPTSIINGGLYKIQKLNNNISLEFIKKYNEMEVIVYN